MWWFRAETMHFGLEAESRFQETQYRIIECLPLQCYYPAIS
ncbi:hypothetical protein L21SP2_0916 [Salinispira pacifica]|uniref:Uncharacterized protein n=1 Tax=Salinispira pacifica TaxID=1307761 RepID=V5WGP8_9SPIO|nr:hypothetical protein L21SP2_0916 [Salinispira pacifica]